MDIVETIVSKSKIKNDQVKATIDLLDQGNTLPFIARYRKEATGNLDEDQIREIIALLDKLRSLEARKITIFGSIEAQGLLTDELRNRINNSDNMTELEDLYGPFKPKRRTRAMIAREKGLGDLAEKILDQVKNPTINEIVKPFLNDQVSSIEEALTGARDIVAEIISENATVRQIIRAKALKWGTLTTSKNEKVNDERSLYLSYYQFENKVDRLYPHQILAINRGEREKILQVKVVIAQRDWINAIEDEYPANLLSPLSDDLALSIKDAAQRLLLPAIERDVRRELTERAESHAIEIFSRNLKALLSQPPLSGRVVMGIDPGFRTGSKVAIVDQTGKIMDSFTIYPHPPQNKWLESLNLLREKADEFGVNLITIGNGTASRETEKLVAELTRDQEMTRYLIVNEAGASVYSASPLARAEMPDLDVSIRGAVSIARRAQDPLAELVKIDPRSIGVGLYQHDVDQVQLSGTLGGVVESVVNSVGVDVNTASPALLAHVNGVGPKLAEKIVNYRDSYGVYKQRTDLNNVPGLGQKAYEQAVGFLRVRDGLHPLDSTSIHPESYPLTIKILQLAGLTINSQISERKTNLEQLLKNKKPEDLAQELNCGVPTLNDIIEQLVRPGRDPRLETPAPILRKDVLGMEDLQVGMVLTGTVRNVVDFGAFVDIGVKQDGLLHRTQIPPGTVLGVNDIIDISVVNIDAERGRIGLGWVEQDVSK